MTKDKFFSLLENNELKSFKIGNKIFYAQKVMRTGPTKRVLIKKNENEKEMTKKLIKQAYSKLKSIQDIDMLREKGLELVDKTPEIHRSSVKRVYDSLMLILRIKKGEIE